MSASSSLPRLQSEIQEFMTMVDADIKAYGYSEVSQRYKALGAEGSVLEERFSIELRHDEEDRPVVVKYASLEDSSNTANLKREAGTLAILNAKEVGLKIDSITTEHVHYDIQNLRETFQTPSGVFCMVTEFAQDDTSIDEKLTGVERIALLLNSIAYLQSLENVEGLNTRPYMHAIERAEKAHALPVETINRVKSACAVLDSEQSVFPYTVVHGDPHRPNMCIHETEHGIEATIMDVESVHMGSRFEDYARLYLTAHYAAGDLATLPEFADAMSAAWGYDLIASDAEIFEAAFTNVPPENREFAEACFRACMCEVCADKLAYYNETDGKIYELLRNGYNKALAENLEWLEEFSSKNNG